MSESVVPTLIKYTSSDVENTIIKLSEKYSFLSYEIIGESIMGNNIYALKIGSGKTRVLYNSAHHANEWITAPLLLKFAEDYCYAYASDENICEISAKMLFEKKTLYIIPMVNPDGTNLVNGAIDSENEYYKHAKKIADKFPDIPFPDGWKANIAGTDLNINYPAMWGKARDTKFSLGFTCPAPRDYVGSSPLSSPESRALYDFTLKNGFHLTISYHTQGKVIYWKYIDRLPQNSEEIARYLSKASGYRLEITPDESGYAGYKDWFISKYDKPGYTIEAGNGENPLPIEQFDEIYNDNKNLLVAALNLA